MINHKFWIFPKDILKKINEERLKNYPALTINNKQNLIVLKTENIYLNFYCYALYDIIYKRKIAVDLPFLRLKFISTAITLFKRYYFKNSFMTDNP